MFSKSVAVLISGRAGTGKSTSAKEMQEYAKFLDFSATIASFAFGVKHVAYNSFGWDGKKDARGRKLLQDVGRIGRDYDPDIWVNWTFNKVIPTHTAYPLDLVFIDDWRFPNEYEVVKKNGLYSVYRIRLIAPEREILAGTNLYNDVSETSLTDDMEYDWVINNSGNLASLVNQLYNVAGIVIKKENSFGGK